MNNTFEHQFQIIKIVLSSQKFQTPAPSIALFFRLLLSFCLDTFSFLKRLSLDRIKSDTITSLPSLFTITLRESASNIFLRARSVGSSLQLLSAKQYKEMIEMATMVKKQLFRFEHRCRESEKVQKYYLQIFLERTCHNTPQCLLVNEETTFSNFSCIIPIIVFQFEF